MAMTTYLCANCAKGMQIDAGVEMITFDAYFLWHTPRPTSEPTFLCSDKCLMDWATEKAGYHRMKVIPEVRTAKWVPEIEAELKR